MRVKRLYSLDERVVAALEYWARKTGINRSKLIEEGFIKYVKFELVQKFPEHVPKVTPAP